VIELKVAEAKQGDWSTALLYGLGGQVSRKAPVAA